MATAPHTLSSMAEIAKNVATWVGEVATLTQPERIYWCDGSVEEYQRLRADLVHRGELQELNPDTFPGCYLYRSDPTDVARVEHLTFVCTKTEEAAGPNNNWLAPAGGHARTPGAFFGWLARPGPFLLSLSLGPLCSPPAPRGGRNTRSPLRLLKNGVL